jgi:NAD(P)-dependent dehydrogenase (short-subunit alcohol dehydrogenase family)
MNLMRPFLSRRDAIKTGTAAALGLALPHRTAAQVTGAAMSLKDKVVMVTGSTDGLGREVAGRCATLGATVIVHGRNQERGKAVVSDISNGGKGSARFYAADFASLDQVRTLARAIDRDYDRLDVLVNNAGVWLRDRQVSKDGHEMHFAVNYLAGFLLTRSLLPTIVASAPSRIVNVSSLSAAPIDFSDVMLERPGRAGLGYAQSKLAQVMFTIDFAAELRDKKVTVTALHPATLMDTTLVREAGAQVMSTVDEGATAVMQQITGDVLSGQFYNGLRPARPHAQANDEDVRARLRQLSMQLTGSR